MVDRVSPAQLPRGGQPCTLCDCKANCLKDKTQWNEALEGLWGHRPALTLLLQAAPRRPAAPNSHRHPPALQPLCSLPQHSLHSHPASGWPQPSSGEHSIPVSSFSETHHVDRQPLLHSQAPVHPALHNTSSQPPPTRQHSHLPAVLHLIPPSFPHAHIPTSSLCASGLIHFSPQTPLCDATWPQSHRPPAHHSFLRCVLFSPLPKPGSLCRKIFR